MAQASLTHNPPSSAHVFLIPGHLPVSTTYLSALMTQFTRVTPTNILSPIYNHQYQLKSAHVQQMMAPFCTLQGRHTLPSDTQIKCSQCSKPILTHSRGFIFSFMFVSADTLIPHHTAALHTHHPQENITLLFTPSCHAYTLTGRFTPTHIGC